MGITDRAAHNRAGMKATLAVAAVSRNLIEAAVKGGVKHFIFSSTAATYGIPDQVPIREDQRTEPINPYGRSKLMAEQMLDTFSERYSINHAMFRYFNVAGASAQRGEDHEDRGPMGLLKRLTQGLSRREEETPRLQPAQPREADREQAERQHELRRDGRDDVLDQHDEAQARVAEHLDEAVHQLADAVEQAAHGARGAPAEAVGAASLGTGSYAIPPPPAAGAPSAVR